MGNCAYLLPVKNRRKSGIVKGPLFLRREGGMKGEFSSFAES